MDAILRNAKAHFAVHVPAAQVPANLTWGSLGIKASDVKGLLLDVLMVIPKNVLPGVDDESVKDFPIGTGDKDGVLGKAVAEALIGIAAKPGVSLSSWYTSHALGEDAGVSKVLRAVAIPAVAGGHVTLQSAGATKWLDYRLSQTSTVDLVTLAVQTVPISLKIGFSADIHERLQVADRFVASHGISDTDVAIAKAVLDYYKIEYGKWFQANSAIKKVGPAPGALAQSILAKYDKINSTSKAIDFASTVSDLNLVMSGEGQAVIQANSAASKTAAISAQALQLIRQTDPYFPPVASTEEAKEIAQAMKDLQAAAATIRVKTWNWNNPAVVIALLVLLIASFVSMIRSN